MHRHAATFLALLGLSCAVALADKAEEDQDGNLLPRVALGVTVEEVPMGPFDALRVQDVAEGGPADKAGLKKGDLIIRVANREVDDYDALMHTLAGYRPGEKVTFTVVRDREPKRLSVTLGEPGKEETQTRPTEETQTCAFLGVLTVPVSGLTEETRYRLGVDDEGVMVMAVVPASPASRAGLRHGDVITTFEGKEIETPEDLREEVRKGKTGKEVTLKVQRGEHTREVKATLMDGPCDVRLFVRPRPPVSAADAPQILQRLERRLERIERRLEELEGNRNKNSP